MAESVWNSLYLMKYKNNIKKGIFLELVKQILIVQV